MLSTRSQNIALSSAQDMIPLDSTRNPSFKTPARSLKHGRVVHDENSVYGHPKTIGFAGRNKHTVLFSTPATKAHPRLATDKAPRSASKSKALAEITNKTPFKKTTFPVTPGPASLKPSKSFAIYNDDSVVPSTRRISSTRKKLRLPRSAIKTFETPETKGNHWDVSDVSIEASMEDTSVTEEDYDDVEYAPPTAIEPKFDPGIDMPDYKEVGATLMSLIRQPIIPDDHDPVTGFDSTVFFEELGPIVWEKLDLPEILPEPFSPMIRPKNSQTMVQGTQSSNVVCPKVPSTGTRNLSSTPNSTVPTSKPSVPNVSCLSKPGTSRIIHTRIPSLSKAKVTVTPATTQTSGPVVLKSRTTGLGHARIASVPSRPTNALHTRTGSVPSRTMTTTQTRSTRVASRPTAGSKPVVKTKMTPQRRPRVISQPPRIPDDTVLSILADSADESLEGEFLFHL